MSVYECGKCYLNLNKELFLQIYYLTGLSTPRATCILKLDFDDCLSAGRQHVRVDLAGDGAVVLVVQRHLDAEVDEVVGEEGHI